MLLLSTQRYCTDIIDVTILQYELDKGWTEKLPGFAS